MIRPLHQLLLCISFVFALQLVPATSWAGEIVLGAKPLETEADGKITAAARRDAVKQLENVPGEDMWNLYLWAKIDKGAAGPLYVEFFGTHEGKSFLVKRHEHSGYQGEKYVSMEIPLEGREGFNKDREYTLELSQVDEKNKNIKLGSAKISLKKPAKPVEDKPKDEKKEEKDEEEEAEDEGSSEETPSRGGSSAPEEEEHDVAAPPIEPPERKRGCSFGQPSGALPLLFLVLALPRRRASSPQQ